MNWSNWPRVDLDCQSPCGFGILSTRRPWYLWVAWSFACCPASSSSTMSEVGFGQWHAVMWMTRAMPVMLHLLKIWKDWHEKLNFGKRRTGVEGWQCTNDQPRGKRWPTTLGESSWLLRRPQPPRRRNTPPCTATCTLPINITKEQDDRKSTTERTLRAPGGLFHCPFHLDHSHNSSCFTILLTLQLFTTLVATRRCRCLLWSDQVESFILFCVRLVISGILAGGIPGFRMVLCCFHHLRGLVCVSVLFSLFGVFLVVATFSGSRVDWPNMSTSCWTVPTARVTVTLLPVFGEWQPWGPHVVRWYRGGPHMRSLISIDFSAPEMEPESAHVVSAVSVS